MKGLSYIMGADDYVDLAIEPYQQDATLRFLTNLIPGVGGAIDAALTTTRDNIVRKRQETYFAALEAGKAKLRTDFATSEPFVHRYLVTAEAVVREAQESKIHLFANLLLNGPTEDDLAESDYKAFVQVLNELSERELALLIMLEDFEANVESPETKNPLQRTMTYWGDFVERAERELGVPKSEFHGVMTRIARTGMYYEITGGYTDYAGGHGGTTAYWKKFKNFVLDTGSDHQEQRPDPPEQTSSFGVTFESKVTATRVENDDAEG